MKIRAMKRSILYFGIIAITIWQTSCSGSTGDKSSGQTDSISSRTDSITNAIPEVVEVLPDIELDNFEFDFFKETAKSNIKTNFATSPVGASFEISMIANICDSALQKQILKALKYEDLYRLNQNNRKLIRRITKNNSNTKAYIGNSLWLADDPRINLNPNKKDSLRQYFNATVEKVDFRSANALPKIREWGQIVTAGNITPSLSKIDDTCGFILMSLLYYSGRWIESFNENETKLRTFHKYDGDTTVNMMSHTRYAGYYRNTDFKAVTLYLEDDFSISFLLPRKGLTADSLISSLTSSNLSRIKNNSQSTNLKLSIPKFHINARQNALETFKLLGFHISPSQFNGISKNATDRIEMSQLSKISVVENGVEASSESTTISCILGWPEDEPEPIIVTFDRPFVFLLQHNRTKAIIMAGQYVGPDE